MLGKKFINHFLILIKLFIGHIYQPIQIRLGHHQRAVIGQRDFESGSAPKLDCEFPISANGFL